ncbi:MAG: polymer-forming cytoskeletal protein [Betaproteobacteria bacterium]|nr:MAG: polymer-forming cytoskeletal protein [Betaproteobacteria bacterium]
MFGKKVSKPPDHIDTLIGADTCIEGDIGFSGGLRVDGRIRGNVVATGDEPSTLVLSEQATIEGKIQVSHAVINGTIIGPIHTNEYLELQTKARVSGDVYYRVIEIQLGALIEGKLVSHGQSDDKVVELISVTSD